MDSEQNMEIRSYRTPIQNFYARQSIFITGGTGFLGNILIEKLLRSCPDISTIYLLIRSKKDKCPETRLDEMFKKPLYDRLKREVPNFHKKIVPITGDLDVEGFGLSENDKNILINKETNSDYAYFFLACIITVQRQKIYCTSKEVSIIFHMAANLRFNEKINVSTVVNVNAVDTILKIAKYIPNLKSFIHVSTAYANSHVEHIEERIYTYPINHKDLITLTRTIPENVVEEKIAKITSQWPNIYTFTKAIAEGLVRDESGDLPVGIFRPALVLSSVSEPLVGWVDNLYGPLGVVVTSLLGITRFQLCNPDLKMNVVPVDFTVNALIASAWDVCNQYKKGKDKLIYNFVAPVDAPTWSEYAYINFAINKIYPLHNTQWLPSMTFFRHETPYKVCIWLGHLLPALVIDAVSICTNRSPRMWKLYMKIHKFCKAIAPFGCGEWSFSHDNVEAMWNNLSEKDQQLFKFQMKGLDWTEYIINQYKGIRLYLLNEDDSTLKVSRIRYKRLYLINQTFRTALIFAVLWIIWSILEKIFV